MKVSLSINIRLVRTFRLRMLSAAVICMGLFASIQVSGQTWTELETKGEVTPRQGNGFMSCKGKFFQIGGEGRLNVDIYDPTAGQWTQGMVPPVEMHHFQAVRYGDQIFVVGAFTGSFPNEKPLDHIYIYNAATDEWLKGDPIPEERQRGSAGVAVYRGQIYIICGTRNRQKGEHTSWVDRYDIRTGKWKKMADAPHTRDNFHVGTINGKIYAAGGRNTTRHTGKRNDRTVSEIDVYDLESGKWETLPEAQNLPTPRAGCTSVAIMDHLLVIGGESTAQEESFNAVEAFDVESGEWKQWGNLNHGRHGTQAFMCVGAVFITSGSGERNGGPALSSTEMLVF